MRQSTAAGGCQGLYQVIGPAGWAQVRLDTAADRPAGSYSGGMRRRLSVAAALLGDPRVVYLDGEGVGYDKCEGVSGRPVWTILRC